MDDDSDKRVSLFLRIWAWLVVLQPGDVRRKASRLIVKGDELTDEGNLASARAMYNRALALLQETGVHHLRKKALHRLVQVDEMK